MSKLFSDFLNHIGGCKECGVISSCAFLKFALYCTFYGFLCIGTDFAIFAIFGSSFLKITYLKKTFLRVFFFWIIGAFLVGYIGAATQLINIDGKISALVVGISWQLIFAKWAAGKVEKEDRQSANAS
jgi:membrane associated rhomboid family serine protease